MEPGKTPDKNDLDMHVAVDIVSCSYLSDQLECRSQTPD